MKKKIIVWFRNDLRLHDNRCLVNALNRADEVVPVYIFDPRQFEPTHLGFPRTAGFRTRFLVETVSDLRKNLQAIGSDLVVRVGKPEIILAEMARRENVQSIFFSKEVADEEVKVEQALEERLAGTGIGIASFWMSTLYYPEDIPYSLEKIPVGYSTFRKGVEKKGRVKEALAAPTQMPPLGGIDPGPIPDTEDLGIEPMEISPKAVLSFKGGETEAINRVKEYIWETQSLKSYKYTRNQLLGENYSSKFSPWLAVGALSPRFIYEEVKLFEREVAQNVSTYWLVFELIWRDYFRFWTAKNGNSIFQPGGIHPENAPANRKNEKAFQTWMAGRTGMPFIDANMRELNETGFMSNRGRQNAASFLIKDLGVDWRWGAWYFESMLIDYDVCSNWGNWAYVAGVGADSRPDRYFNVMSQALRYDPKGDYVRHWIRELKDVPGDKVHFVFDLDPLQMACYHIQLGVNYPHPVVRPKAWGKYKPQS